MRIIVSDTSCMIDLRKVQLLEAALELPHTFVMPNTLFEDEWLCLTADEKRILREKGLDVRELPGPSVERASRYFNQHRRLQLNDCFALVLAEDIDQSILLTGDGELRRIAEGRKLEVRGVLWLVDELHSREIRPPRQLHDALCALRDDVMVFLPKDELHRRIRRLAQLI